MIWIWAGFILFVLLMLALDLGVFHRNAHVVSIREALGWSAVWIGLGLAFSVFVYYGYEYHWMGLGLAADAVDGQVNDGASATVKYLTGYVIEKSLSVDNVFVIAMIFAFMAVPRIYQHRVLFWGILGALVMRGVMIGVGAELIARYHWILYVFGVFLLVTAVKMLVIREHSDPAQNIVVRGIKRWLPVTDQFHGEHFLVRAGSARARKAAEPGVAALPDAAAESAVPGTLMLTPLALALILVETTDLIFAVDSIPAIFAITADPFLVFTSNVFAILGLRSLYFALADMIDRFRFLKVSLAMVLAIVGLKMLLAEPLKAVLGPGFNLYLLLVVAIVLAFGVIASFWTGPAIEPEDALEKPHGQMKEPPAA
ncbi:MAG: TerC family protein [Gemmatimonadetes bacterium]|nr:TerC family protein [Gemmatimonadota bacterium]